ncbi:MAG: hypothetical protein PH343_03065 [Nitrospira sp.]|nr:hypothetical protein [Nitrospira sp.]
MLPPRCTVIGTDLQKESGDSAGAYIRDNYTSYTSGTDLTLGVRWWTSFNLLEGGSQNIKYRVVYKIAEPFGVDCTVNYR